VYSLIIARVSVSHEKVEVSDVEDREKCKWETGGVDWRNQHGDRTEVEP